MWLLVATAHPTSTSFFTCQPNTVGFIMQIPLPVGINHFFPNTESLEPSKILPTN